MAKEEHAGTTNQVESEREKLLRETIGVRTIVLTLVSVVAVVELLIIVQLAAK